MAETSKNPALSDQYTGLDLRFALGLAGRCWDHRHAVVLRELLECVVDVRVVPIRAFDGAAKLIRHCDARCGTKVFQRAHGARREVRDGLRQCRLGEGVVGSLALALPAAGPKFPDIRAGGASVAPVIADVRRRHTLSTGRCCQLRYGQKGDSRPRFWRIAATPGTCARMNKQTHSSVKVYLGAACAFALAILLGCDVDTVSTSEADGDVDGPTLDSAENPEQVPGLEGVNQCGSPVERNLANLAGAAAEELGRWEATRDFQLSPDGARLTLSAEAEAHCAGDCPILSGVLALQNPLAAMPDNDPAAVSAAMVAAWQRQKVGEATAVPLGAHELTRLGSEPAACGELFWFEATRADCSGDCGVESPETLASKLVFAGFPDNPYLQFQTASDFEGRPTSLVGIDPTYGLNPDPSTCAGSCDAGCTKISSTPITEACNCCNCGGVYGDWVRSTFNANTYLCIRTCTSTSECAGGQVCLNGNCSLCTSTSQCGNNQVCNNGICQFTIH
jgi:hypothetical protein